MLTLQKLKDMEPGHIIASGLTTNSPDGIYMTGANPGEEMIWVAKRGGTHDWALYIHWAKNGIDYCINNGDKIINAQNIKKLVPCDNESFNMYRY